MKTRRVVKLLFIMAIFVIRPYMGFSQIQFGAQNDTIRTGQNQNQEKEQTPENKNKTMQKQSKNGQGSAKAAKQINSARPDMSKSRGAKPNIVRPSGSAIPKGVGKPGGAGRPVGR